MLTKLPIISSPFRLNELIGVFRHIDNQSALNDFTLAFSALINSKHIYLTNSGLSSFYLILNALKEKSDKKEVILPAYTAGSLVVAVTKAGLTPVLCDISLKDFNLDEDSLLKTVSPHTLAIVCVHMFGIAMGNIGRLREKIPSDIFLIEDCAQAMGSKIKDKHVGNFTDISFFSFNRGKNIPTYGGGCIATNSPELPEKLSVVYEKLVMDAGAWEKLAAPIKISVFSLAVNPLIYGLGYPFISCFKDVTVPVDFNTKKNTNFQIKLAAIFLKRLEKLSAKRYYHGMFLIDALKNIKGITVPVFSLDIRAAFNRLPILFKDLDKRKIVEKKLWEAGIETSRMYLKPLHHMFDLGYKQDDFPNANYLAEHLLTLPVHPLVKEKDLLRMIDIIKGAA